MSIPFKVRGSESKKRLIDEYNLQCVGHIVLLKGQKQKCVCGKTDINSDYFAFKYVEKNNIQNNGILYAGSGCGKIIINLAQISKPPLVNPLQQDLSDQTSNKAKSSHQSSIDENSSCLTALNREAITSISLVFMLWGFAKSGFLSDCIEEIIQHPDRNAKLSCLKAINNAIINTYPQITPPITLTHRLQEKFGKHQSIKCYHFNEINKILLDNNIESFIK